MPLTPLTLSDTFDRVSSSSWGTQSSTQMAWSTTDTDFTVVSNSYGQMRALTGSGQKNTYVNFTALGVPDSDVGGTILTLVSVPSSISSADTDFGPILNRTANNTYYFASLQVSKDLLVIGAYVNGVRYTLDSLSYSLGRDNKYWIRFQRGTGVLRMRVWEELDPEPASWTLVGPDYDGAGAPGAGDFGMFRASTANDFYARVHAFYGYTSNNLNTHMPVNDTMNRINGPGFGISDSKHTWSGNFGRDPFAYAHGSKGSVDNATQTIATIPTLTNESYVGYLGPSVGVPVEATATLSVNSSAGTVYANLGILGTETYVNGEADWSGYYILFRSNETNISLRKRVAGTITTLATSGAIAAIAANTKYRLRFQCIGNVLKARIWLDGAAEPGTWDITHTDASSPLTSGKLWFRTSQDTDSSRAVILDNIAYTVPDTGTTTPTTTGTLVSTSIADTTLALQSNFANDTNTNNSIVVEYRRVADTAWTTFGGTKTRNASNYTFTITGLTKNTQYAVRVTYSDADTVVGTNPVEAMFTTTNQGLTTGPLTVTSVTTSTVNLSAVVTDDSNNNATATIDYRTTSADTILVSDSFDNAVGEQLSNRPAEIGGTWIRHSSSSAVGTSEAILGSRGRLYESSSVLNNSTIYYNNITMPTNEYTISAYVYSPSAGGSFFIGGRLDPTVRSMYYAGYYQDNPDNIGTWRLGRYINGALTVFSTVSRPLDLNAMYFVELEIRNEYKVLRVNGEELVRTTDNTHTLTGHPALWSYNSIGVAGTEFNQLVLDDYKVLHRTVGGSWLTAGAGAMSYNTSTKTFTRAVTGLSAGTGYEFRVTYADANGVTGPNPVSTTAMTEGQGLKLLNTVATPSTNTAVVEVFYDYDTNNDSSMAYQYRNVFNRTWQTLTSNNVKVDRPNKRFIGLISGLKPSTTYEVRVTGSDPNGFIIGSETTLTTTFATDAYIEDDASQTKHYLWKVYNVKNKYVTTWHDAGEPEFAWHENGGVTDLTVELPRMFNAIADPKSGIAFRNRVDVWCIDPSSDGMGENMVLDPDFNLEAWTLGPNTVFMTAGGPDDSHCIRITASNSTIRTTRSSEIDIFTGQSPQGTPIYDPTDESIYIPEESGPRNELDSENLFVSGNIKRAAPPVPVVVTAMARALGGKMTMYVEAYDSADNKIDQSDDFGETVGTDWQQIRCEYTPPAKATSLRVCFENDGAGTMYADKCYMRPKEALIYRGRIESFTPEISPEGEKITINVLGLVSQLSDDYIEFLQYVAVQPNKDSINFRENRGPQDPGQMMRDIIDIARFQNKGFELYYTDSSIRFTGQLQEYTFRDQQLRATFDKVRDLCPPHWHYFVEPDGKVHLRGPEHGKEHILRIGVEIVDFRVEKSITNLKNFIHIKGRQDEDGSEPDGHGSIHYYAFDQKSIDLYGKRMLMIRDAQITTPQTARTWGEGRLEELNREEQRIQCNVPDEKTVLHVEQALRGYNIEEFRPGDTIRVINPSGAPNLSYWDSLIYDEGNWDYSGEIFILTDAVPVKTVQFHGRYAVLELSERPPKSTSDFGRLYRMLQLQDSNDSE